MRYSEILTERFINLIGNDERKRQYQDQVYDLLQKSYQPQGGIKGSGFASPDDMRRIPMWKLAVKDGRLVAVVMYKDKNGRKLVASGTDGSHTGKRVLQDIVRNEDTRSYSEKSKSALNFYMKSVDDPTEYMKTPQQAQRILPDNPQVIPVSDNPSEWPVSDSERESTLTTLKRYPELKNLGYFREIGGEMLFKVMTGTPEKHIQ